MNAPLSFRTFSGPALVLLVGLALLLPSAALADPEGRAKLREVIQKQGNCLSVALTESWGDAAILNKGAGYSAQDAATPFVDALIKLHRAGRRFTDIALTESGGWVIVYNDNGYEYRNIPSNLVKALAAARENHDAILSVAISSSGDWALVGQKSLWYSPRVGEAVKMLDPADGGVRSIAVNKDGLVIVQEKRVVYAGEVPTALRDEINSAGFPIFRIKITDKAEFFCGDETGANFRYQM